MPTARGRWTVRSFVAWTDRHDPGRPVMKRVSLLPAGRPVTKRLSLLPSATRPRGRSDQADSRAPSSRMTRNCSSCSGYIEADPLRTGMVTVRRAIVGGVPAHRAGLRRLPSRRLPGVGGSGRQPRPSGDGVGGPRCAAREVKPSWRPCGCQGRSGRRLGRTTGPVAWPSR